MSAPSRRGQVVPERGRAGGPGCRETAPGPSPTRGPPPFSPRWRPPCRALGGPASLFRLPLAGGGHFFPPDVRSPHRQSVPRIPRARNPTSPPLPPRTAWPPRNSGNLALGPKLVCERLAQRASESHGCSSVMPGPGSPEFCSAADGAPRGPPPSAAGTARQLEGPCRHHNETSRSRVALRSLPDSFPVQSNSITCSAASSSSARV